MPPARHPMAPLYFYHANLSGQDCVVSRQEQAEWGNRAPRPLPRQSLPAPSRTASMGWAWWSPAPRCYPGASLQLCFPGVAHLLRVGCIDWMP